MALTTHQCLPMLSPYRYGANTILCVMLSLYLSAGVQWAVLPSIIVVACLCCLTFLNLPWFRLEDQGGTSDMADQLYIEGRSNQNQLPQVERSAALDDCYLGKAHSLGSCSPLMFDCMPIPVSPRTIYHQRHATNPLPCIISAYLRNNSDNIVISRLGHSRRLVLLYPAMCTNGWYRTTTRLRLCRSIRGSNLYTSPLSKPVRIRRMHD